MARETLKNLIGTGESTKVEWKQSLSEISEIIETIAAFSNTKGGKVLIGVDTIGKAVGVQVVKGTLEELANRIAQNTDPKIQPRIVVEKTNRKNIIVIDVKESLDKLVLAFGRPFKRVGNCSVKMCKDEYERLILEKHKEKLQFDKQVCNDANIDDIDKKKVSWYLRKREEIRKVKKPQNMSYEKLLINIGTAQKAGNKIIPTNSGILFFGKNPQRFFVQSQLRVAKFKGTKVIHPVIDRIDCQGTLWEMIGQAEDFIRKNIRLQSFRTGKSFMREDKFEYPMEALREAMINALIHRDYRENSDARIFIFDDRIEIINPGTFPKDVTPKKPVHKAVNPVMCGLMYDIGFIEKYGSGIYMMKEMCQKWGNEKPYFELHPVQTKLIFKSQIKESTIIEMDEKILKGLNERQREAVNYMRKNFKIARKEYAKLCKTSERTANRELMALVQKGIIKRKGSGTKFYYELAS
ncbi:MAG: RNA-binding domain-containing protein [bacterium]